MSTVDAAKRAAELPVWMGMSVRALQGEEFSAFGVSKDDGGVQIIPIGPRPAAAGKGFQADDLIQQVNGQKVKTPQEFLDAIEKAGPGSIRIGFVRSQQFVEVTLQKDQ
jgi:S1-C subfamily serine protease